MPTDAQLTANLLNAQSSTGPATPEGRAVSSRNATTTGLFTARDYICPDEHEAYARHTREFETELHPVGIVERTWSTEITGAAWRLRRCLLLEAAGQTTEAEQKSIDRARAGAHNILLRSLAELRRLQTERQIRNEIYPDNADLSDLGLAGTAAMISARNNYQRSRLLAEQTNGFTPALSVIHKACSASPADSASFCKTPEPPQVTPRNALCPCKSGQKFKRCCGVNAPPVLGKAA